MKIKNWIHAIDLTIKRHEMSEKEGIGYTSIIEREKPDDWTHRCPLCEYIYQSGGNRCNDCLWIKFTEEKCLFSHKYDFRNNQESIERLKEWKELLKKE